jgi:hypothetical protein
MPSRPLDSKILLNELRPVPVNSFGELIASCSFLPSCCNPRKISSSDFHAKRILAALRGSL